MLHVRNTGVLQQVPTARRVFDVGVRLNSLRNAASFGMRMHSLWSNTKRVPPFCSGKRGAAGRAGRAAWALLAKLLRLAAFAAVDDPRNTP